jgi:hypothetical protein
VTHIYRETDPVSGRWTGNSGGIDLSAFQIDQNFYQILSTIATIQSGLTTTISIAYITITGDQLTFHMTDHSLQGPFTIPPATFVDRGTWQPFTSYSVNDTFNINGTVYLVTTPFTSGSTFSTSANFYAMLSLPGAALPTGGAVNMMLAKSDGHNFDVYWKYPVPVGGVAGQYLSKVNGSDFNMQWSYPIPIGGTTGQYLTKIDGTNFNTHWSSFPAVSMENLSDFSYTSPHSVGQVVQWTGSAWQNATLAVTFAEISDIALTSPHSVGDVLTWNGSNWQNEQPVTGSTTLHALTDVNVTEGAGIDGFMLYWSNGTTKWAAKAPPASASAAIQKGDGSGGFANASAGVDYGFANVPQNSQSAAYTTVLADAGKHIFHPSADTTARTFTIDSNANVAFPIGTTITFVNQHSGGVITIAITSDTMRLAGTGTTGSRTLAADGIATALKVASTEWLISGTGLT